MTDDRRCADIVDRRSSIVRFMNQIGLLHEEQGYGYRPTLDEQAGDRRARG
jgi:hypothetical protein